MRLDIKLNYEIAYDCLESLIPPIARWFDKDFELMSMNSWGFHYKPELMKEDGLLSSCFSSGTYTSFEYLEKYHGIQLIQKEKTYFEDMINIIKNELNSQKPVIIYNDSYFCPWYSTRYKKLHGRHFCLAVGYQDDNIIVLDSQYAKEGTLLPLSEFEKGYDGYFLCNDLVTYQKDVDWKGILLLSISDKRRFGDGNNMFNSLRVFAKDLVEKLDLTNEMKDYVEIPSASQIVTNLSILGNKRKQYSFAIRYLSQKYKVIELDILASKFEELSNRWSTVFGLLIKAYYSKNDKRLIKRMADRISELADEEEKVYLLIKDIYNFQGHVNSKEDISLSHLKIDISKVSYVDLRNYANCKGFGYDLDPNNLSEFSDGGRYIYIDSNSIHNVVNIGAMSFNLLNSGDRYDNISCKEQMIQINLEPQSYIMFLGCSEWGSHTDNIKLIFEGDETESIPIQLTNIASTEPVFGEQIINIGKYVVKTKTCVVDLPFSANLFSKMYSINNGKSIKGIKLPYCPNIHIFAISFGV